MPSQELSLKNVYSPTKNTISPIQRSRMLHTYPQSITRHGAQQETTPGVGAFHPPAPREARKVRCPDQDTQIERGATIISCTRPVFVKELEEGVLDLLIAEKNVLPNETTHGHRRLHSTCVCVCVCVCYHFHTAVPAYIVSTAEMGNLITRWRHCCSLGIAGTKRVVTTAFSFHIGPKHQQTQNIL